MLEMDREGGRQSRNPMPPLDDFREEQHEVEATVTAHQARRKAHCATTARGNRSGSRSENKAGNLTSATRHLPHVQQEEERKIAKTKRPDRIVHANVGTERIGAGNDQD